MFMLSVIYISVNRILVSFSFWGRNSSHAMSNCEKSTKFSKTRFRYVSLVTVLRSQSRLTPHLPSKCQSNLFDFCSPVFSQAFVIFSQFDLGFHEFRNYLSIVSIYLRIKFNTSVQMELPLPVYQEKYEK